MSQASAASSDPVFLGIEGGGTRTTVLMVDARGTVLAELARGPAVLPLMSDRELQWHLRGIAEALPRAPQSVCIGLAGARSETDRERLRRAACRVWPGALCLAVNDLETALAAAPVKGGTRAEVLVLSGTGSCCYGRTGEGRVAKVGGRGHVIGDRGSACDIGLRALRAVMADLDHHGGMGPLGAGILNALVFNEPDDLIPWSAQASKTEIAALAVTVFAFAARGDALARRLLADAAAMLAEDACACAEKLAPPEEKVRFIFNGGVLLKNPAFLKEVCRRIRSARPEAVMAPLKTASVSGAVALARRLWEQGGAQPADKAASVKKGAVKSSGLALPEVIRSLELLAASPTEHRNPRSMKLDRLSAAQGIELMLAEDAGIPPALRLEKRAIAQVVEAVARAFQNGGHLFYAGAGTSGRLGVLDASEIPPTFRAPREQVQGIIAGGRQALWSAVEGAEDDAQA
ncbi:MAG TPA: BadF/BadG/BcrA/BcrD ATPase family protein, partial [Prosthecobacter sp.]|nr:BadF/BadG/BcrA/BcrD ATPase family protein [Prosthecobacter sp.]